jgi:hypothetical protein
MKALEVSTTTKTRSTSAERASGDPFEPEPTRAEFLGARKLKLKSAPMYYPRRQRLNTAANFQ